MNKTTKLRISGLAEGVKEDDLKSLFSRFGEVNVIYISPKETKGTKNAFIVFKEQCSVDEAIHELNYQQINGNTVKLTYGDENTLNLIKSGQNRIMVQGIDTGVPEKLVYEAFSRDCQPIYCCMPTASTGKFLGICLLTYRTKEECDKVISKMDGYQISGKTLTVKYAPSLNK